MSSLVTKLSATQTIESLSQGGGNDGRSLVRPYNAAYYSGSGAETGYLKITLPESWNNDMLMMTVDLYMYGEGMTSLRIGGYSYATSSTWSIGPQAHIVSTSPHSNIPSYKIEYGHDGTFMAIYISHASQGASSTWTYPQVVVRDVHLGFSSVSDNMAGAWDIEFTATLGTITATKILTNDNPILGGGSGVANKIAYWLDGETLTYNTLLHYESGKLGLGTAGPSDQLHIYNSSDGDSGVRIDNPNTGTSARTRIYLVSNDGSGGIYLTGSNYTGVSGWADRLILNTDSNVSGGILIRPSTGGIQLSASGTNNPDIYVNTSGNVGIGQSSPSYKLDVTGTARITSTLVLSGLSSGTDNTVLVLNSSNQVVTDEIDSRVWGSSLVDGSGSANYVAFWSDSNTITGESSLFWDATNDFLGINTSSPEAGIHNNSVSGLLNYRQHFYGNSIYSYSTGILIATSIQTSEDSMFELSIEGNSYFGSFGAPIISRVQGYNYVGGGNIIQTKAISNDPDFTIDVFHYGGYVYFHFEQTNLYQTYTFKLICPHRAEKITSITNAIKPVSGVTNSVTITPAKLWTSAIDGSGSGLDADLLDGSQRDSSSTGFVANSIPVRSASGYLYSNYFNMSANTTTATATKIAVETSSDGFLRWQTPSQFLSNHGGLTTANVSGTANYISKFTSSNTIGNSQIFDNGTNVGIGTSAPFYKLDVATSTAGSVAAFRSTNAGDNHGLYIRVNNDASNSLLDNHVDITSSGTNGGSLALSTGNSEVIRITTTSRVGIKNTSPTYDLDVTGNGRFTGNLLLGQYLYHDGDTDTYLDFYQADGFRIVTGGAERIRINNSETVINEGSNDYDFRVESNNETHLIFVNGGADIVGIGTSSYTSNRLSVESHNPTISVTGTNYYKAGYFSIIGGYNIASGVTDSGYRIALDASSYVNDSDFAGTLGTQHSIWARHGAYISTSGSVITNSYGVYIDSLTNAETTITNLYGLYQASSSAKNYFGGAVGINNLDPQGSSSDGNGSSIRLNVNGGIALEGGNYLQLDDAYRVHYYMQFAGDGTEYRGKLYGYYGLALGGRSGANAIVVRGDSSYVGINNVSPSYQLDVIGDVNISSDLYLINDGSQVIGGFGAVTTSGTQDWNHSTNARSGNGYTLLYNATNGPVSGEYHHPFSYEYSTKNGSGNMTQFAIPYRTTDTFYGFRSRFGGTWTSWVTIWTSANDGASSGLDADLLDGQQGSYYLDYNNFSNTPTIGNGTITLTAGTGLSGSSSFTTNQSGNTTITLNNTGVLSVNGVTGAVTAANLLTALLTVDGSGSGLDADSIDGIDSSDIVRISQTQTITGTKTFSDGPYLNGTLYWRVSSSDAAIQRADARDDATNFSRLHWYGLNDTGGTSNFRHAWYDGSAYINVTASNGAVTFDNLKLGDWSGGSSYQGLFHADQTSGEYVIMSNDVDTFISSTTSGNVYIRGGGNIATHQIVVSPSARATASGSNIVVASDISGTASYIPRYTGTATLGNSNIYDDGTNIAIGSTSPSGYKLNVNGSGRFASDLTVAGNLASVQSITASGTVTFSGLGTGTDNSVVVLNGSNQLVTDEIDSRVWGSSLVDGSGSTSYLSKWSDGNTIGNSLLYDTGTSVGILSDSHGIYRSSHILSAGGGRRASGGGSTDTGYIKITLPNSWTDTMVSMWVDLFEYATYRTCSFYLAGYTYAGGSYWVSTTAIVHGDYKNTNVDYYKVEFAHDGSKCCIYISKTELGASSVWSYPYITVRDVTANHSSVTYSLWDDGWAVSGTDDGTGKTTTVTQYAYQNITRANVNGTANYLPRFTATNSIGNSAIYQSGSFIGIGTTSPSEVLEVNGNLEVGQSVKVAGKEMIEAISSGTDVYIHGRVYNNAHLLDGIYLNYNSAGTTAAHLRFYANGTNLRGWVDASTGNWILGSGAANSHKLLVEGTTKINTSLGINGDAGTYSSKLHIVGDGTNPNISVSSANIDTSTSSSGRTFYGWMPIKVEGTTRYIPLYS